MKVVFVSNYYNHHQSALSEALYNLTGGQYVFIQTIPMEEERKQLGWGGAKLPPFVKQSYLSRADYNECLNTINRADVIIAGSAPEKLIKSRIKSGKLAFRYSERIYKKSIKLLELPIRAIKYHFSSASSKNTYLLCSSAYAAADYAKTFNFVNKTYKWGYFPAVKQYDDFDALMDKKEDSSILYVSRMIDCKHPELPIKVAKRLKEEGYSFHLSMIGNGIFEEAIKKQISDENLSDCVHMLGSMNPQEVRSYMEKSKIFLFTSDFNEGWGAVLNEAMNSGCAVVASHAIGAVPYLLEDGENGYIYKNGDFDDLYKKVKYLLDNPNAQVFCGQKAYQTMQSTWNAQVAAERFLTLCSSLEQGKKDDLFETGPCSRAGFLQNNWYKTKL